MWTIVTWNQFKDRKMKPELALVNVNSEEEALEKMRTFNMEKQLTTTEYATFDLSSKLSELGLEIVDLTKTDSEESDES